MKNQNKNGRQAEALTRLKNQLELGKKNTKEGPVDLTEKDIKRINKEIIILEKQV